MYGRIGGNTDFSTFNHASERIGVATFPDQHHIRGCARAVARRSQKRLQMFRDGALRYRPAGMGNGIKIELNGSFIGTDVAPAVFNDAAKNGGKQRTFSASHDARDQNQPMRRHGMFKNLRFDMQVFQRGRHGGNCPKDNLDARGISVGNGRGIAAIPKANPARFLYFMGKIIVGLTGLDQGGNGIVARQTLQRCQQLIRGDGLLCHRTPCSVQAHPGRKPGTQA